MEEDKKRQVESQVLPEDKDPKTGRFVKGNGGGPGSNWNQRSVQYRDLFHKAVSEAKFKKLVKLVYTKAMKGDMVAAKLLFERICGKLPEGTTVSVGNGTNGNAVISIKVDDGNNAK